MTHEQTHKFTVRSLIGSFVSFVHSLTLARCLNATETRAARFSRQRRAAAPQRAQRGALAAPPTKHTHTHRQETRPSEQGSERAERTNELTHERMNERARAHSALRATLATCYRCRRRGCAALLTSPPKDQG